MSDLDFRGFHVDDTCRYIPGEYTEDDTLDSQGRFAMAPAIELTPNHLPFSDTEEGLSEGEDENQEVPAAEGDADDEVEEGTMNEAEEGLEDDDSDIEEVEEAPRAPTPAIVIPRATRTRNTRSNKVRDPYLPFSCIL